MANKRINKFGLQIAETLFNFIEQEALPSSGITSERFWQGLAKHLPKLVKENKELLQKRDELQIKIDAWHKNATNNPIDEKIHINKYKTFLQEIGYLESFNQNFKINTNNVDSEITNIAGAQLVVPVNNARYALNAANARWGSLYDALYGTDAVAGEIPQIFSKTRAKAVIAKTEEFLDECFSFVGMKYKEIENFELNGKNLLANSKLKTATLKQPKQFIGYLQNGNNISSILLKNNDLHLELRIDKNHDIGKLSNAGIKDIQLEAAITTICDCEDSVTAVDAEDKVLVYRNWLRLNEGTLSCLLNKNNKTIERKLNNDKVFQGVNGKQITIKGCSLLLVRNVGHLMTNNAILLDDNSEIPEGIMDAFITSLCSLEDIKNKKVNSKKGSIYIVKPKMHGSKEVAFSCKIFSAVEKILGLEQNTIKIGIMDEERRTSVNLKACIYEARNRIIFTNTGFLDRTGDEIHTSMLAGPMLPKADIKKATWLNAYENSNVDTSLQVGFNGKAQIGKGMWAMPDLMADMLKEKIAHPKSGANCAWVPSPTAAVLHATHYHKVNVLDLQKKISKRKPAKLEDMLTIPIAKKSEISSWTKEFINREVDNNCQGILGYVVRWINQGIGCSKVPDINNIGLMEDRATLRISSQHLANWLEHNIISREQVISSLKNMAKIVDLQNSKDSNYTPMSDNYNGTAFQAAMELIFNGKQVANGYTEPSLHKMRLAKKVESA